MAIPESIPKVRQGYRRAFSEGPISRTINELGVRDIATESVYPLPHARLVFANYTLLQHDFPQLREARLEDRHPELRQLEGADKTLAVQKLLDTWLMTNAAVISSNQAAQRWVNTPIECSDEEVTAFRPRGSGRGVILSLGKHQQNLDGEVSGSSEEDSVGLLDVKGVGVSPWARPSVEPHSNGLLRLGQALREVMFEELVEHVFLRAGLNWQVVPSYGVLDLGFNVISKDGWESPAGMLIRRAHRKLKYDWDEIRNSRFPEKQIEQAELEVELRLRQYGLTSVDNVSRMILMNVDGITILRVCNKTLSYYSHEEMEALKKNVGFHGGEVVIDGLNIQFTGEISAQPSSIHIVDFGCYEVEKRFDNHITSLFGDRQRRRLNLSGEILRLNDPRFIQPNESISVPYELWGATGEIWGYRAPAKMAYINLSNPLILGFNLAEEFRSGALDGNEVREILNAYVQAGLKTV